MESEHKGVKVKSLITSLWCVLFNLASSVILSCNLVQLSPKGGICDIT